MRPDLKNSGKDERKRGRGLLWFIAGGIVALILVFVFPALRDTLDQVGNSTVKQAKTLQKKITKVSPSASADAPTFDFYRLLTHPTQIITSGESDEIGSQPAAQAPVSRPGRYILQVASVRDAGGAEKLKAQLALWGISAHVQTVVVQGETWHRIRVGPVKELARLNALRAKLDRHHLQPLLIRVGD